MEPIIANEYCTGDAENARTEKLAPNCRVENAKMENAENMFI